jgi:large subunit ribosomal protein L10
MNREQKRKFVEEWSKEISGVPYAILVDYRGLTVAEEGRLRRRIKEAGNYYRVVKNNLAKIAVPGTLLEPLSDHFVGPCAVAWCTEDPVGMAKILVEFSKDAPALEIKAGVLDGKILDSEEVRQLSKMPSREEMLAKLLYLMKYPVQGLATSLKNIIRNLAIVLNQVAGSKGS